MITRMSMVALGEGGLTARLKDWREMKWEELRMLSGGWAGVAGCITLRSHTVT